VEVVGNAILGSALVAGGDVEEGLRHLDACATLAIAEEFDLIVAPGWALCHTVSVCTNVGDFGRAGQWARAMHTWSARWQGRHFFGTCRTAYGDVLATRGDWTTAEEELSSALQDMRATRPAMAASTAVRLGRLRASQGNPAAARELFESAVPLPTAVLALGELDMDAGDPSAGVDAADRVLRNLGDQALLERFPALELRARAAARSGDAELAAATAEELERDAERLGTPYMRARSRLVRANVLSAAGDHDGARRAAEDAVDLFGHCAAPYDGACARMALSEALAALGREERAAAEARAAREAFARLRAIRQDAGAPDEELSPRESEILRLVAQGMGDAQIAQRLFLSPHTVHRHVANIRTKLRTPSRAAAVAYASRHGLL
jgi:ATP/maltotriose-dependent transcriptional regulator MalT